MKIENTQEVMEENKVLTYAELKEFCNGLTEEQLTQKVKIYLADNEQPSEVNFAEELGEDHYHFPEFEYTCTKSDYDKRIMCDEYDEPLYLTIEDAIEKEEHHVALANRVYLHSIDG